jgi:hypothetical protein
MDTHSEPPVLHLCFGHLVTLICHTCKMEAPPYPCHHFRDHVSHDHVWLFLSTWSQPRFKLTLTTAVCCSWCSQAVERDVDWDPAIQRNKGPLMSPPRGTPPPPPPPPQQQREPAVVSCQGGVWTCRQQVALVNARKEPLTGKGSDIIGTAAAAAAAARYRGGEVGGQTAGWGGACQRGQCKGVALSPQPPLQQQQQQEQPEQRSSGGNPQ